MVEKLWIKIYAEICRGVNPHGKIVDYGEITAKLWINYGWEIMDWNFTQKFAEEAKKKNK